MSKEELLLTVDKYREKHQLETIASQEVESQEEFLSQSNLIEEFEDAEQTVLGVVEKRLARLEEVGVLNIIADVASLYGEPRVWEKVAKFGGIWDARERFNRLTEWREKWVGYGISKSVDLRRAMLKKGHYEEKHDVNELNPWLPKFDQVCNKIYDDAPRSIGIKVAGGHRSTGGGLSNPEKLREDLREAWKEFPSEIRYRVRDQGASIHTLLFIDRDYNEPYSDVPVKFSLNTVPSNVHYPTDQLDVTLIHPTDFPNHPDRPMRDRYIQQGLERYKKAARRRRKIGLQFQVKKLIMHKEELDGTDSNSLYLRHPVVTPNRYAGTIRKIDFTIWGSSPNKLVIEPDGFTGDERSRSFKLKSRNLLTDMQNYLGEVIAIGKDIRSHHISDRGANAYGIDGYRTL